MDLKEYKKLLDVHDWYFRQSDDRRVYERGKKNEEELLSIAKTAHKYQKAYDGYLANILSPIPVVYQ